MLQLVQPHQVITAVVFWTNSCAYVRTSELHDVKVCAMTTGGTLSSPMSCMSGNISNLLLSQRQYYICLTQTLAEPATTHMLMHGRNFAHHAQAITKCNTAVLIPACDDAPSCPLMCYPYMWYVILLMQQARVQDNEPISPFTARPSTAKAYIHSQITENHPGCF